MRNIWVNIEFNLIYFIFLPDGKFAGKMLDFIFVVVVCYSYPI